MWFPSWIKKKTVKQGEKKERWMKKIKSTKRRPYIKELKCRVLCENVTSKVNSVKLRRRDASWQRLVLNKYCRAGSGPSDASALLEFSFFTDLYCPCPASILMFFYVNECYSSLWGNTKTQTFNPRNPNPIISFSFFFVSTKVYLLSLTILIPSVAVLVLSVVLSSEKIAFEWRYMANDDLLIPVYFNPSK